jgi:hypothetical protein
MKILEGGNVFKNQRGQSLTQRINQTDVKPTLAWLDEMLPGLDLQNNTLGSSGIKDTSGDLDIAVDANRVSKEQLETRLTQWAVSHGFKPEDYVRKSGTAVHFKTPIDGRPERGYVQTDFMFMKDVPWSKFVLGAMPADSKYKGRERNVLMNSIAKSLGYKLNQIAGIADRSSNKIISDDPDRVAKLLLNRTATRQDLASVETILQALSTDSQRDAKLADFKQHMEREGLPFMESETPPVTGYTEVNFLAKLRDRIVNQGMQPLIETKRSYDLYEQEPAAVGGKAKGIEHLEDYVFRSGSAGVDRALQIADAFYDDPKTGSVKWDGKPALVFGRKPDTGEFVLTDDAGFTAERLFTSTDEVATDLARRDANAAAKGNKADRIETLLPTYEAIWPYLEAATPQNFRGYVKGDLLYTSTPEIEAGNLVFQPNTVAYRIPVASDLGKKIANSNVGVAIHTMYADVDAPKQPLSRVKFNPVEGLLLIEPIYAQAVPKNNDIAKKVKTLLRQNRAAIDTLFNPMELRAMKITDLAKLAIDYINKRVDPRHAAYTGDFRDLVPGFMAWLQQTQTPQKVSNIAQYLRSPTSNEQGLAAAFLLFELLHDLKLDLLGKLDAQVPGNEGWVFATPAGYGKAVNRFDFTARNKARNN